MPSISNVLGTLTEKRRKRLADDRGCTIEGLAKSYSGKWVDLMKDMTNPELAKALKLLDDDDLRVVALRAFDGREVALSSKEQEPEGIIVKLCHKAPEQLRKKTWKDVYAKILRDVGWESERIPKGLKDKVKLQRIFE